MLNTNKKGEIFDSFLESNTGEVDSTSEQFEEPITSLNTNRRLNVTTRDQRNPSDDQRNSSDDQRNSSDDQILTSVSDEVSGEDLTNRLSEGMNAENINVERGTNKSFDLNDLFKTKTEMMIPSKDQINSPEGTRNSPDNSVRVSVRVDVSDGQLTKRLNVIEELITQNTNVGRDANKIVNDRLGRLEIEVGIIACIFLLILIILLVFIVGVLTIVL